MNQTVVLGIGNRLMGDDGIGNYVVEELKRQNVFPDLRMAAGETDVEYCMDELRDSRRVILIDAANLGAEPCTVTAIPLKDAMRELPLSFSVHNLDLLQYLKQYHREEGLLIAIEACTVEWRVGLSSEMEKHFRSIVADVILHMKSWLNESKSKI
jgi:hydrogenase maturation protease